MRVNGKGNQRVGRECKKQIIDQSMGKRLKYAERSIRWTFLQDLVVLEFAFIVSSTQEFILSLHA